MTQQQTLLLRTSPITVWSQPCGCVVALDGKQAYVANYGDGTISVIDTATNTVTTNVSVGYGPWGVAVTPDGTKVYVTNYSTKDIS